jgi:homopolymeric O-antigen transport system permease protein
VETSAVEREHTPVPEANEPSHGSPHRHRTTVIKPTRGWRSLDLGELWENRELLYFLIWRDIKVRYKQTAIGAAWAVVQPLLLMLVFTLVMSTFLHVKSGDIPYPVFVYSALLPWTFFAQSLAMSSNSLIQNSNLISKIYFPRAVLPIASTSSFLLDLGIGMLVLIGMMVAYGIAPTAAVALLPLFVLLAFVTAAGCGFLLSATNARYRDVVYAVPLLTQLWLFATPVAYPMSAIPKDWQLVYSINPMVGVVEGFRWALLGDSPPTAGTILVSSAAAITLAVIGVAYFQRSQRTFADVI